MSIPMLIPINEQPILIDCQYIRPQFAGAYLITSRSKENGYENRRAAFVENNTAHSIPLLLKALEEENLRPEDVEYLMITHLHLDHAGGSSKLMEICRNATLLVHPRASKHMIDPSHLVASVRKVYGNEAFDRLYGEIGAIDASRVRVMQDGEELQFGSHPLHFFYTRGHANHHFCIFDSASGGVFTGDSFGLAYPPLQKNGLFIFPSTSPSDFDAAEARNSIQKIIDCGAQRAYLTHFGEVQDLPLAATQLLAHLDVHEKLMNEAVSSPEADEELDSFCETRLKTHFQKALEKQGMASDSVIWEYLEMDVKLNAQGLAHAARKKREKNRPAL